ncbi:efflux transporter outer membrane subunit [Ideonella livida]|uniref:Efflux transporter outer membrane subunit n=1 Tax=Ideonella livida TaxID=2707176 RepID=A0A7C9PKC2_9BURK|nr:efflux transporter outer membrane subunit [Ideonella livida]NDY93351.1 efflux transporter outer membrane subunit [Ideonella livida]
MPPAWLLPGAVLALLAGCAQPGPSHTPLALTTPAQVGLAPEDAGQAAPAPLAATLLPPTPEAAGLGDAALTALMREALAGQPSLAAARARLARAQAAAGLSQASHGPQVQLSVDATRQHYTANGMIPPPVAGNTYNSGTVQVGASWAPDFFGQHAAELAAAVGQARAAEAEQVAAAQLLLAQMARAEVNLARLLAQQDLLARSATLRQQALALVRQRHNAGLDTQADVAQAEVALKDLATQQAALAEQVAAVRLQLASLAGQPARVMDDHAPRLSALRLAPLPAQLPADLLGRRPDLVAARWRVEAATQDVKGARAQFYPNLNLTAFIGLNALGLDQVLQGDSRQWGVSPALRLPLFDGGRLRAQLGGRQAEADAAIAQYNGQVLEAVREARDALVSLLALEQQQVQAQGVAESLGRAQDLAGQRQAAGLGGRLPVLQAELQALAQQRLLLDLQARKLDAGVLLHRALGGGWS